MVSKGKLGKYLKLIKTKRQIYGIFVELQCSNSLFFCYCSAHGGALMA